MKKLIGLVSVLAASLIPITASAQIDAEIDGIGYYLDNDDKTAEVTSGKAGDVVIPSTVNYEGNTYTVTTIGAKAFLYYAVKTVRLPITITKIGREAFRNCISLKDINIPEGVKRIEDGTFYDCSSLNSIILPEGLESIGNEAFRISSKPIQPNEGLLSIAIPNSVSRIGTSAFYGCGNLTSIILPEQLTTIRSWTFAECGKLTAITIPQTVTVIQDRAFYQCFKLEEAILPEGLLTLGEYAFCGCPLTSINIPKGISELPVCAFNGHHCVSIDIPNHVTSIRGGALSGSQLKTVNIPNSVTYIGSFAGCSELRSITIPNSVTEMGDYAFQYCEKLRKVRLSENLISITHYMFYGCHELQSVIIPNGVFSIGEWAFFGCDFLESIDIPNSVTSIGAVAFESSGLKSVSIGEGVEVINKEAFSYCNFLEDVYCYATNPPYLNDLAFRNTPINNATLHVPNSSIDSYSKRAPWSEFGTIVGIDESVVKPKCATPTITYENNKLHFTCATLNSECVADIEDADVTRHYGSEVQLGATYIIKVFATASGYDNSDVATATLCWIDQQPQMEGITGNVAQVPANAVLIQSDGGMLTVQGIDDNTIVRVYDISGAMLGASTSRNGMACINTNLQSEAIVIVKIGDKSVKVKMN